MVTDSLHLTLVENLTISGANWTSANFSLLINKTTSSGAVSVSAAFDFIYSDNYNSGLDGSGDICNSRYVTIRVDANGNSIAPVQGYLCVATGNFGIFTPIYTFIPSTRETRLIARGYQPSVRDYRSWVGWHPTSANCWFTNYPGQSVFQACYNGDYRALTPGYPESTTEAGTPEQVTFTDIFGGPNNEMGTQIANCAASGKCRRPINSRLFAPLPSPPQTGAAVQGNYLLMCGGVPGGTQDSPGYITLWDIRSIPATLAWAGYTFDQFPVGYGGIHACIRFGTGQFNIASLNGSFGQLRGPLAGPWQQTPAQYNRGTGFTTNTAVAQTDGFECPPGLSAPWQALGAKPLAQGGIARCLEFIVPGDFCSVHSSPPESAAFPCPWNSASNYSLIKPIDEGDEVADARIGPVSYGEKMLVVKVTRKSATNIDLLVFRYSQQSQTPNSGFTCGTYDASEWTHSNGWTMQAAPYHACHGSIYWIDALDSTQRYVAENPALVGTHSDFGPGANGFTYVAGAALGGYITRADQPMPAQIGGAPTNTIVANPTFGSANLSDNFLQSYPSKRQQNVLTASSEMDWALDVRHYNPGAGNPAETPEGLFGNRVTPIAGHRQTYLITMPQTPDPRGTGFIGWAGFHMLADASGPKSVSSFGDATPWHYCFVLAEGECVSGSRAGQMYVSVPEDLSGSPCLTNSYAFNAPCISNNYPYGFWVTQFGTTKTGFYSRRLTGSFVAPGRQYNFTNAKTTPDGLSAQVQASWLEGQRTDLFWVKLPPFPAPSPNAGTVGESTPVELKLFGAPGDSVRVAFGYAENGGPTAFYCTSRAEVCYAPGSTDPERRFVYGSEAPSYMPCPHFCVVPIPAVRGRIFYYQVERHSGANTTTGPLGAVAVQ